MTPSCHHGRVRTNHPPSRLTWVRRTAVVLFCVDVVAFVILGANWPARPTLGAPLVPTTSTVPVAITGVTVTLTPAGALAATRHCFLVADTPAERARGLMGRRTLGGYTGMAFVYASPSNDSYYMRDTLIPLSIAFFTGAGAFVSSTTMAVCPASVLSCPLYAAAGLFRLALEVPAGRLGPLGVGAGTTAHLGGPCTA